MADDIVARLRGRKYDSQKAAQRLMDEAADEIERLRALLENKVGPFDLDDPRPIWEQGLAPPSGVTPLTSEQEALVMKSMRASSELIDTIPSGVTYSNAAPQQLAGGCVCTHKVPLTQHCEECQRDAEPPAP